MVNFKVVNQQGEEIYAPRPIHPGEVLADELEAREIKQKVFAEQINMRPSHLNELLKGKRNFTAQIALRVAKILSINASFWMRMQGEYFLDVARLEEAQMQDIESEV